MELLGDMGQLNARFGLHTDGVNLGSDRCTVCAECTTGMEIFLATLDGSPR
jgi:hypothetical protein